MISKTDLKTIYEWAKHRDFPVRKTSVSGYYKRSYGTDKIKTYSNKEIYSFPLKFGRKKPIIRESLIPPNIVNILKNERFYILLFQYFRVELT